MQPALSHSPWWLREVSGDEVELHAVDDGGDGDNDWNRETRRWVASGMIDHPLAAKWRRNVYVLGADALACSVPLPSTHYILVMRACYTLFER